MTRAYRVSLGWDRLGRERNRYFATLESARAFCNAFAARHNVILGIVESAR